MREIGDGQNGTSSKIKATLNDVRKGGQVWGIGILQNVTRRKPTR